MKQESLLNELFGTSDIQSILLLINEKNDETKAKAYWALATFTKEITLDQIKIELLSTESDLARIFLAGALFQLDSSFDSLEMKFLSEYYLTYYYDIDKEELKIDFTDVFGRSAQVIGLILWSVGYEYFATNDLATYGIDWLVQKE
ncbi:MAG: hypothetical protein HZR80_02580 [Candidatus Heimdallarchaeota archaeon]